MMTRKEYLESKDPLKFSMFYGQFLDGNDLLICRVAKEIEEEGPINLDSNFNIFRNLQWWDTVARDVTIRISVYNAAYEKSDDWVWTSDKLCILKEGVLRRLIEKGWCYDGQRIWNPKAFTA